jgi:hypothetical protein
VVTSPPLPYFSPPLVRLGLLLAAFAVWLAGAARAVDFFYPPPVHAVDVPS